MKDLIQRKVLISMLFLGLSVLGFFSYRFLPMELYPDAEYPTLNVTISCQNEMEPNYIRNKAVIPVEGVISSLEGVEEISTRISSTNARISISFSKNTNIKYAFLKLEEKMRGELKPTCSAISAMESGVVVRSWAACLSRTLRMKSAGTATRWTSIS